MAWVSYTLFICLGFFAVANFIELVFDPKFERGPITTDELLYPKATFSTLSSIGVTLLAYSYQQNVFPIYTELKVKTNEEYDKTNLLGLLLTATIYISVSLICLFMFGSDLESSVLLNIGEMRKPDGSTYWEAYVVQISFMAVLMCHIPFIFFSGKESLLIMIDEVMRKSISNALWHKL